MVEHYGNDSFVNTPQFDGLHNSQKLGGNNDQNLSFFSVMEEGMRGALKPVSGFDLNGLSSKQRDGDVESQLNLPRLKYAADAFPSVESMLILKRDKAEVMKAANIVDETNTLGTDDQKQRLSKMFEEKYETAVDVAKFSGRDEEAAKKAGEKAVRDMVDQINAELKNRNSESRISLEPTYKVAEPYRYPYLPKAIGSIVVTRDGDKTDHIVIHEPESAIHRTRRLLKPNELFILKTKE